ncbi:MAG: hypothetical protein QNJ47_23470 [Nostocaceae cyanobacterium]|nr:hypothetical protein [Nostocaceae cyanobacterium]
MLNSYFSVQVSRRIFFSLFWLLLVGIPRQASIWFSSSSDKQNPQSLQPLKIYRLSVLPEIPQQRIKLNPPATKIVITIQPGDVAILCGYNFKVYTCVSGKPLEINAESNNPIKEFWIQNPLSYNVRVKIAVYEHYQDLKLSTIG